MAPHRNNEESPAGVLPPVGDSFRFACHPEVDCFNACCRELDLVLTPYDLLRLKNRLSMEAAEFIERHTMPAAPDRSRWPLLRLAMVEGEKGECPFVRDQGCSVYEDRPSACRTYPLARAAKSGEPAGEVVEQYFKVEEEHCHGWREPTEWTPNQWVTDQGLVPYHHFNDKWMEVLTHPQGPGHGPRGQATSRMFFLASYNLDKFIEFVATERFRKIFAVTDSRLERLKENQEDLLALAIDWMKFSFFGDKTVKIDQKALKEEQEKTKR